MQHVRTALYTFKPGMTDEVMRRAQEEMVPILRRHDGFVAYGVVKTGENSAISLSFWQSREQADASVQVVASWVKDHMAGAVESVQNHGGDLAFFSAEGIVGS